MDIFFLLPSEILKWLRGVYYIIWSFVFLLTLKLSVVRNSEIILSVSPFWTPDINIKRQQKQWSYFANTFSGEHILGGCNICWGIIQQHIFVCVSMVPLFRTLRGSNTNLLFQSWQTTCWFLELEYKSMQAGSSYESCSVLQKLS